jgi:hypothetical protein
MVDLLRKEAYVSSQRSGHCSAKRPSGRFGAYVLKKTKPVAIGLQGRPVAILLTTAKQGE